MSKTNDTLNSDDKTLIILAHALGFPGSFIPALIIFLLTKNETVKKHCKAALNWQISFLIYMAVAGILTFILIGLIMVPVLAIASLVFTIIAVVKASEDPKTIWEYPLSLNIFQIIEDTINTKGEVVDVTANEKEEKN